MSRLMIVEVPSYSCEFKGIREVRELVCCGECRCWERLNYEAPKEGWCNDPTLYCDGRWTNANDYCSYGERSANED